jgi:crossover junction endodeoxyribonuclease RusA
MARRPANRDRPDDTKRPTFEFCVTGRPVSAQAANRLLLQTWKAEVTSAARVAWPRNRKQFHGDVELRVTHYSERRIADRDNLIKPIQDALQGVVYGNDRQVKDSMSNWRNINSKFTVRFVSMPLAVAFSIGDEFLHIRLWTSPDTEDLG